MCKIDLVNNALKVDPRHKCGFLTFGGLGFLRLGASFVMFGCKGFLRLEVSFLTFRG